MEIKRKGWNLISRIGLLSVLAIGMMQCSSSMQDDQEKIQNMISSMTLQQKAQLVIGTGMSFNLPDSVDNPFGNPLASYDDTSYVNMVHRIRKYLPGAAGFTAEYPDIGITTQVLSDGPAGLRIAPHREGDEETYYATAFPIATVLASSWDTDLVNRVGQAMGNEVLEYGADVLLAPALNLQRDPLCGRNFEYYSEDPLVAGKMAAAMVNGVQSNGVGTSLKHFAANNQETNRMSVNTIVSERALRELYLKSFRIAVEEAHPWTVMSSYNKINGTYTSQSPDLLTKVLRDDWGFEGYVMTDWTAGDDVVAQMKAGNDLIMPGNPQKIQQIITAVESGELDESVLDHNIERILSIMMKTPKYRGYEPSNDPDLEAHAEVTRQAATDGMVLLENKDDALPISNDLSNVAAFGTGSYEFISGGTGSGDVNEAYTVSLIQGLHNAGFTPNKGLADMYDNYIEEQRAKQGPPENALAALMGGKEPIDEMAVSKSLAQKMASTSDVALITISRNSGEGDDRKPEEGDFYLTDTEKQMISNVSEAFQAEDKKAIVVLNTGGAIETASWTDQPDAVLLAWQPGQEAGNSVMDVLTGKVNPSGKLAVTFPIKYEDSPTSNTFPGHKVESGDMDNQQDQSGPAFMRREPWEITYEEDIFVGYRYYNTFDQPVSYEFGYGLSYTNFDYSNLQLNSDTFDGSISFSLDVTNTGEVAGREVVQVYASKPDGQLVQPEDELVAFDKTASLDPGETTTLNFTLNTKDLASFDKARSSWIVEPGSYQLKVGASSRKINQQAMFDVAEEIVVQQVSNALTPNRKIEKLRP